LKNEIYFWNLLFYITVFWVEVKIGIQWWILIFGAYFVHHSFSSLPVELGDPFYLELTFISFFLYFLFASCFNLWLILFWVPVRSQAVCSGMKMQNNFCFSAIFVLSFCKDRSVYCPICISKFSKLHYK
jgi:hypothetical protein